MIDSIEIECPDCQFKRTMNWNDIPSASVSATCPRCGLKFPLPRRTTSQSSQSLPHPLQSSTPAPSRFTLPPSARLIAKLLLVFLVPFFLFVGRIFTFNLPEEEVTLFKTVDSMPTSEPAPNVPVLIAVELRKRNVFDWGDGGDHSDFFKSVYFYTSTDSSGKLRVPGTRHHVLVMVPLTQHVSETIRYYVDGKDAAPDTEAEIALRISCGEGPRLIKSPKDLVCFRRFDHKPAAEIKRLVKTTHVIPLTSLDRPIP